MRKLLNVPFEDLSYLIVFLILVVAMLMSVYSSAEPSYDSLVEIEVAEGDTLWAIASNYSEDVSIQAYLSLLRDHNDLQGDRIYPGQKLMVPKLKMKEVAQTEEDVHLLANR